MKQIYLLFIIFSFGVTLQSCSSYKAVRLAKQGYVDNKDFITQIPFRYDNDLIFIEVEIDKKHYNFIFDTGAEMSVIGQHITGEIEYKVVTRSKVTSSSNSKQNAEFIELPKISFSNIDFESTGAIIADLSHFDRLIGCEKIDGIIGNNLLRKSIWQIDYKNETIKISDNILNLKVPKKASEIVMNSNKWGNVFLDVEVNGVKSKFIFDTGFVGKIRSDKQFLDTLFSKSDKFKYITEVGRTGSNLNGITNGKIYYTLIDTVSVEGIIVNNQIMSFKQSNKSLIGNQFFKNFTMTLDWGNDKIFLDKKNEFELDTLKGYELIFSPNYLTNRIEIIRYRDDYLLEKRVSLNSEIKIINDIDVSNFSTNELCEFWESEKENIQNEKTLEIVIFENGLNKKIKLTNKILLSK